MSISTVSVLSELMQTLPRLRPQIYFKASLTALSHAMEDQVLASSEQPLLIASFQRERFYRQEAHRYRRIAQRTDQVYVLAAPETDFTNASDCYETVAFDPSDSLSQEWHLIVIAQHYAICLVCRERQGAITRRSALNSSSLATPSQAQKQSLPELPAIDMDPARQFEGIWTSDRDVSCQAAELLLQRILLYRPELTTKVEQARSCFQIPPAQKRKSSRTKARSDNNTAAASNPQLGFYNIDSDPFVQRLVTYLQAGQYKLLKAYRSIADQERKERLVNSITTAIRRGS
ncbi:MAG: histidine kinase, partial [Chroococcidiopsidaceae cyanobacterium CP_BM_ER_R8_30]|nr:histidine kinase [Chroococcidiopsidaceae cyanobacterium CP_BM_ER_R8_30]